MSSATASTLKDIESIVPQYTARPLAKQVNYDENKFYNFLIFDTETNTTGKSAELCQLSVTDQSGLHQFSTYILPVQDIDYFASKVNKLKIVKVNDKRKLYKENKEVSTLPLKEAISQFLAFVSKSVGRAKSHTNKNVSTVLLGHNSLTFDVPVLLRNCESDFKERFKRQWTFGLLTLSHCLKHWSEKKFPICRIPMVPFQRPTNHPCTVSCFKHPSKHTMH